MNVWVEFAKARLDEQSAAAPEIHHRDCASLSDGDQKTFSCDCGVPSLVLRQVAAMRQILQLHAEECCAVCLDDVQGCPTYRAMASVWPDHEAHPSQ